MKPQNDHQWEIQHLNTLQALKRRPRLLMQSCCAVCNSWPLEYLHPIFDITLYYNNSNIYPQGEYELRLAELKSYVEVFNQRQGSQIQIVDEPYDYPTYRDTFLRQRAHDREGGQRCGMCYALRINQAFQYAQANDFEYVTTVMTISRQKNASKINQIARRLASGYPKIQYFYSNFKKKQGIDFAVRSAKALGIYQQEYCGCEYSMTHMEYDV
jgi:predicted adenine nucleotide alpha hydrolase (AANH) superfamily ATPase